MMRLLCLLYLVLSAHAIHHHHHHHRHHLHKRLHHTHHTPEGEDAGVDASSNENSDSNDSFKRERVDVGVVFDSAGECIRVVDGAGNDNHVTVDQLHQILVEAAHVYMMGISNTGANHDIIFNGWGVPLAQDIPPNGGVGNNAVQQAAATRGNAAVALTLAGAATAAGGTTAVGSNAVNVNNVRIRQSDNNANTQVVAAGATALAGVLQPNTYAQFMKLALYNYPDRQVLQPMRLIQIDYMVNAEDPTNLYIAPNQVPAAAAYPTAYNGFGNNDDVFLWPIQDTNYPAMYAAAVARKGAALVPLDFVRLWRGTQTNNAPLGVLVGAALIAETRRNWVNALINPMVLYLLQIADVADNDFTMVSLYSGLRHNQGGRHPMACGGTQNEMKLFQRIATPFPAMGNLPGMSPNRFRLPWMGGYAGAGNNVRTYYLEIEAFAHWIRRYYTQRNLGAVTFVNNAGCNNPVANLAAAIATGISGAIADYMANIEARMGVVLPNLANIVPPAVHAGGNPPTMVVAAGDGSVTVTITAATGGPASHSVVIIPGANVEDVQRIEVNVAAGGPVVINNLVNGRAYSFRARAVWGDGSVLDAVAATVVKPVAVPAALVSVAVNNGNAVVGGGGANDRELRVKVGTNGGDPIFRLVCVCTNVAGDHVVTTYAGSVLEVGTPNIIVPIRGLHGATTYNCVTSAENTVGQGPTSATALVIP